ncbi:MULTISPECIES: hypothetical protein [unclassified Rhizobium]|uniref:hypothetical protein n=1 Tax=unclassified Rhizobium TaxID=2613769 RepID=UPI001AD9BDF9|nr:MULTISPECIES: hypothetical protein [unclassified Rhizobium]MBO9127871.1 hypothetical protein [Rhizobium sp. 16-488-2b]MBO9175159.1 hypothetical protein [Rhizobium sp. 16-488-2a]
MTGSEHTIDETRRSLLASAAASIINTQEVVRLAKVGNGADPTVVLWRDWLTAHRSFGEACRRQQRLETEMLRELGSFPRVQIALFEDDGFIWAYTADEINRLLSCPTQRTIRRATLAELAARHADWNRVDHRIGYSKAKHKEAEAAKAEDELSEALWNAVPRSFAGIAAKLHCVLEMEDPGSGIQEAPWPQLRAILADLIRIAAPDNCSLRGAAQCREYKSLRWLSQTQRHLFISLQDRALDLPYLVVAEGIGESRLY